MDVKVHPSKLAGSVTPPSSKSAAHRALICAILSSGVSRLSNIGSNDDIIASISCAKALGAKITQQGNTLIVNGIKSATNNAVLDCNESGSTLRFFAALPSALGVFATFKGKGRLPSRPMEPMLKLMEANGVTVAYPAESIFSTSGSLTSGVYFIPGNISSQYITGLLFALPLLNGDSKIVITTLLESKGYVDMTLDMLKKFGITITETKDGFEIIGNQEYKPTNISIEADYSGAAFWLCAAAMGHKITVANLDPLSLQSDREILQVLENFGAKVNLNNNNITILGGNLTATNIDANNIPDSIPALAVLASGAKGVTKVYNAQRLRIKESDRLITTADGISRLGGNIKIVGDNLLIEGPIRLNGGSVDSYNDHRIAMSMSIAALNATEPVIIKGANCVEKSYPNFYKDLKMLGGRVDVV